MPTIVDPPQRGIPDREFSRRSHQAQAMMRDAGLDAVVLMTEPEVEYFTGFNTFFWQSPTRPWFVVLPADGKPIGVVPELGAGTMASAWVSEVRAWSSPNPRDEGVSLLASTLMNLAERHSSIGFLLGAETHVRMPHDDFNRLRELLRGVEIVDATWLVRQLRMVKSETEIDKMRHICRITSQAFQDVPRLITSGLSEREAVGKFRTNLLSLGADNVPFLVGSSAPGGIQDIIRFPTDRLLSEGDVLFLDTGANFDGYYSDFDRNFAIGSASEATMRAYDLVYRATEAGLLAVRAGSTTTAVWQAMASVLADGGAAPSGVGRMGHGIGLRTTEWPSLTEQDGTMLQPGMVLAIEPGFEYEPGKIMLHEENIVIRDDGIELLSTRADRSMPVLP